MNIYTSEIHFFINHYESFRHFKVSNCHRKSLMDAPRNVFCDFSIPLEALLNDFSPKSPKWAFQKISLILVEGSSWKWETETSGTLWCVTGNINSTCKQRRAQPGSRSTSPVLPLGHPRGEPPLLTPGVSYQGHPETTSIRGWRRGSARPQQHPGHPGAAEGPAGGGLQSGAERRGRRQEAARSFWRPAAGGRGLAAALGPAPWGGPGEGSRLGGWAGTQPPAEQFPIKFWLSAVQVPAPCFYLPLKAVPGLGWTFWCFPSTWDEIIPTPPSAVLCDCTAIPPWGLAGHAAADKAALHCPLSASNTPCANALFLSPNLYSSAPHTGCSKQTTWKQD